MKKRLLALVLALVMVVAILPVSVLAAPGDEPGQANLTPGPVTSDDNLVTVEKSAAAVDGQPNTYDVTLTVTTKDTVSTTPAQSTDVVLVIDASNSMDRSKLSNAKSAAREFSSIVLGAGAAGENRIAVVSYGKTSEAQCGLSDSYWTVQNAINGIYANGGTNIQAGLKAARDILDDSTADNKVILVLSDGEPTYSFRVQGTAQWTGCYEGRHGRHYWTGDIKKGTVQFTGFDYSHVVGSGSAYSLYNGARLTVTCEHGKTDTVNYTYYKNNGDPTIAEAGYAKEAGCEIYSIYLGGKNDTNAIDTMKGIASGDDHFQTTDDVDELADLFKGIAGEITTPTNAGIVTDPMGDFVELDSSVSSLPGVSVDSEGFTWDVSQTQPTSNPDGSKTYTMTYRVTLDTSALGFTTGVYPLNKTTTFTYQVGSDGQDRTVAFKVPTVYGEAAQYNVTYSWTGAPASGVTLPTDSNSYYAGDVVAVDTTYVNGTQVTVDHVVYTFGGWDTSALTDGKMPANDVEITGTWTSEAEAQYNVTYSWTGAPASGVTLPTDSNSYYAGDVVAVDTTYVNGTQVTVDHVVYTFGGWDTSALTDGKMPANDVEITGTWTSEAEAQYNVTYSWTGAPASGVTLPTDSNSYYAGDVVAVDTTYVNGTQVTVDHVVYTFGGWDTSALTDGKMPANDVEITGTWTSEAEAQYNVTYSWTGAPASGVTLPTDSNSYYAGDVVAVDTTYVNGTQVTVDHVVYTFGGWDTSALTDGKMPANDVEITGTWTSEAEAQYNVTYSWTGAPASGVTLPTDSNSYYAGDVVAVDTTYVNGTTVEIGAFRYTFHGWDTTGLVDGKMPAHDVTINGEWTVTSIGVPGLSVDKTVVSVGGVAVTNQNRLPSAVVGQLIRYQIVVKNTGNVKLTNVKVSDKLWEKGTEITVNGDKYTLTGSQFSIGSLAPKAEIVITYSYRATLKDSVYGYVKNGVTVTSDNGPTTSDEVTIKVYPIVIPDVPEDNTPNWLNTKDHYAYIVGYNDGTVKPNNNITRAEVATIFFRLLTDDARAYYWSTDSGFSDVKPGDWYNNAVSTMVNAGILNGYSDGTFKPNANITRAEFATIAARFLSNSYSLNDRFYDTEGHWAEPYINRAAEVGWINGYNDGSFKPNKAITRAEAVTLVNAVLGREPHEDHLLSRMVTWPDNPKSAWYYEDIQEATNSHDYVWASGNAYEIWTKLLENRNWAKLEKEWSTAYSAPGGDVMG